MKINHKIESKFQSIITLFKNDNFGLKYELCII